VDVKQRSPKARRTVTSAEELLAEFPVEVRALAEQLRRLVREMVPTASEQVYPGWKALGYRDPQSGYFCGIFPQADHVRLLFEHGAALPDPEGLLTGSTRQVRFIEVRRARDIRSGAIRRLLRAALVHGAI
jgi:hypothetical protein